jgi:hypothetical protein
MKALFPPLLESGVELLSREPLNPQKRPATRLERLTSIRLPTPFFFCSLPAACYPLPILNLEPPAWIKSAPQSLKRLIRSQALKQLKRSFTKHQDRRNGDRRPNKFQFGNRKTIKRHARLIVLKYSLLTIGLAVAYFGCLFGLTVAAGSLARRARVSMMIFPRRFCPSPW